MDPQSASSPHDGRRRAGPVLDKRNGHKREGANGQGKKLRVEKQGVRKVSQEAHAPDTLALAVEALPAGVLILNDRGKIQWANAAAEKMFQYSQRELTTLLVDTLLPDFAMRRTETHAKNQAPAARRDLRGKRKDGREIPLEVHVSLLKTAGQRLRLVTVIDIAEREKQRAELEQARRAAEDANRAKSDFLARMSHEIRTPMNLIMGMNALLLDSELSAKQRKQAEVSQANLQRLLHLINDILDLSKVEAGKLVLETVPFNLNEVLQQAAATVSDAIDQKGLRLSVEIDPPVWPHRKGDPERLQQVLLNLLGNAVKFTAQGSIHVKLQPEKGDPAGQCIRFEVTDTGSGIPADQRERVFQPFQQAEGQANRAPEGTGLGLSISKTLVEMMGGRIWVAPKKGPGTKFVFTACLPPSESQTVARPESNAQQNAKLNAGTRILAAEDNPENLFLLRAYLEDQPVVIDTAANGMEAVQKRQKTDYDLILMDIQMPVMDGTAATQEIRKWERAVAAAATPIVALTAHALTGASAQYKEAGCDGYISKPLERAELVRTISEFARTPSAPVKPVTLPGIAALRPRYLANRRNDIANMRKALETTDYEAIRRIAHDCKGTGAGYGFPEITALGRTLEQAAIAYDAGAVQSGLRELEKVVESASS